MLLHECFKPSLKEALSNQKNFSNSGVIILLDHSYCAWAVGNLLLRKKKTKKKKEIALEWEHTIKTLCALFQWTCILIWLSAIFDGLINLQGLLLSQGPVRQDSLWSHGLASSILQHQRLQKYISNYRCCLLLPASSISLLVNFQPGSNDCLRHIFLLFLWN